MAVFVQKTKQKTVDKFDFEFMKRRKEPKYIKNSMFNNVIV